GALGAREPPARRLRRAARLRRELRARLRALPLARQAPLPAGRNAVGRRAADARDRPRADVAAPPTAARRAVARPRADRRPGDLQHPRRPEREGGPRCPRRRAEREARAALVEPRVRARSRAGRPRGAELRAGGERVGSKGVPRVLTEFLQQVVAGLSSGSIYALLALGIVIIYRSTGVVNFAQGEMATFTTFIAWTLVDHGVGYWGAFGLTLVIAFVGGVALERIVVRPVEGRPPINGVILTIGLFILLGGLSNWI